MALLLFKKKINKRKNLLERFLSSFTATIKLLPQGTRLCWWQEDGQGQPRLWQNSRGCLSFGGDMPWAQSSGVRTQQGSKSHPWFLLPGPLGAGISDCLPRSSWKMNKAGIHHLAWDESLSSDRLIWSLVFWTVCVFHREKKQFPLQGFIFFYFFFVKYFRSFNYFFFLVIASILSSRETQRSKSLLHLSPKSLSHVLKGWLQLRDCFFQFASLMWLSW